MSYCSVAAIRPSNVLAEHVTASIVRKDDT